MRTILILTGVLLAAFPLAAAGAGNDAVWAECGQLGHVAPDAAVRAEFDAQWAVAEQGVFDSRTRKDDAKLAEEMIVAAERAAPGPAQLLLYDRTYYWGKRSLNLLRAAQAAGRLGVLDSTRRVEMRQRLLDVYELGLRNARGSTGAAEPRKLQTYFRAGHATADLMAQVAEGKALTGNLDAAKFELNKAFTLAKQVYADAQRWDKNGQKEDDKALNEWRKQRIKEKAARMAAAKPGSRMGGSEDEQAVEPPEFGNRQRYAYAGIEDLEQSINDIRAAKDRVDKLVLLYRRVRAKELSAEADETEIRALVDQFAAEFQSFKVSIQPRAGAGATRMAHRDEKFAQEVKESRIASAAKNKPAGEIDGPAVAEASKPASPDKPPARQPIAARPAAVEADAEPPRVVAAPAQDTDSQAGADTAAADAGDTADADVTAGMDVAADPAASPSYARADADKPSVMDDVFDTQEPEVDQEIFREPGTFFGISIDE